MTSMKCYNKQGKNICDTDKKRDKKPSLFGLFLSWTLEVSVHTHVKEHLDALNAFPVRQIVE